MVAALHALVRGNKTVSAALERFAIRHLNRRRGWRDFDTTIREFISPGMRILDVGAGTRPIIDLDAKHSLGLHVTGLDICGDELAAAPLGAYDRTMAADICKPIEGRYSLIASKYVLEHVSNVEAAIHNMANALEPGGLMIHYMPCRNSSFSIINRLLGNRLARKMLLFAFPGNKGGFPAYYNRCTPRQIEDLCKSAGLGIVSTDVFFEHSYYTPCAPLHCAALAWQAMLQQIGIRNLCATFYVIARKPS